MANTLEELATQLTSDPEFAKLAQQEQDTVFAELAKDIKPVQQKGFPTLVGEIPYETGMRIARNPFVAYQVTPRYLVRQVPQPILNIALPTIGGITSGIPGMTAGAVGAKALEQIRAETPTPLPKAIKELAMTGVATAATGKALQLATGGLHALRVTRNVPLRASFMRSVREAFLNSKKLAGETFGIELDKLAMAHPKQTIDLSMELAKAQQQAFNNPAFKAMLNRATLNAKESALIQSIINQPNVARNLTMKETQSLKQIVGRMLKQKFQQVAPEFTDAHLDANELYHGIRLAQLKAFPEFADIADAYHTALTNFRTVKPYLTKAALEPALLNRFGNRAEIQEAVRELLPKETIKEISRLVTATQFPRRARNILLGVAGAGTIGAVLRRLGAIPSTNYPTQ